jgi:hypothetical protein
VGIGEKFYAGIETEGGGPAIADGGEAEARGIAGENVFCVGDAHEAEAGDAEADLVGGEGRGGHLA